MASRLNRPDAVTKRDLLIGIVCVALLVVAAILSIWLMSHSGSKADAFGVRQPRPPSGVETEPP